MDKAGEEQAATEGGGPAHLPEQRGNEDARWGRPRGSDAAREKRKESRGSLRKRKTRTEGAKPREESCRSQKRKQTDARKSGAMAAKQMKLDGNTQRNAQKKCSLAWPFSAVVRARPAYLEHGLSDRGFCYQRLRGRAVVGRSHSDISAIQQLKLSKQRLGGAGPWYGGLLSAKTGPQRKSRHAALLGCGVFSGARHGNRATTTGEAHFARVTAGGPGHAKATKSLTTRQSVGLGAFARDGHRKRGGTPNRCNNQHNLRGKAEDKAPSRKVEHCPPPTVGEGLTCSLPRKEVVAPARTAIAEKTTRGRRHFRAVVKHESVPQSALVRWQLTYCGTQRRCAALTGQEISARSADGGGGVTRKESLGRPGNTGAGMTNRLVTRTGLWKGLSAAIQGTATC